LVEDLEEAPSLSVLLLQLIRADSSSLGAWIRDFISHQVLLVTKFIILIVLLVYEFLLSILI